MALYTIKELYEYSLNPEVGERKPLLFGGYYENENEPPVYINNYLEVWASLYGLPDDIIARDYGDYVYMVDSPNIDVALGRFELSNIAFCKLHNTELLRVYDAMTTDFNPLDNYDRTEVTTDNGSSTSGATSKTAPDDSETFYNVGSADSSGTTTNTRTSHIHGNIGVVDTVTLIKNTTDYFTVNSMFNYLVKALITDCCYMVDYGNNAL